MGARYTISRSNVALSTTADFMTITAPAARALKIWEIRAGGMGTTSASNEIIVNRSTAGTTPSAPVTPQPLSALSPAATTTVNTAWATQPAQGVTLRRLPLNSNGAINPQIFMPGSEIDVAPAGQISIRSAVGTGAVTIEVVIEEIG